MQKNRRSFLQWLAFAFGSVAGFLPALGQYRFARVTAQTPKAKTFVRVATLEELTKAKGPLKVENAFGEKSSTLWLSQDPKDKKSILALDAACPHAGCAVNWQGENYVCPCHGSTFAADGSRTRGPANAGLKAYETKVENGAILVAQP